MKVITNIPIGLYEPNTWQAADALKEITERCDLDALDQMLDTLWAPNGMSAGAWDRFLVNEKDHIIARFGKEYYGGGQGQGETGR